MKIFIVGNPRSYKTKLAKDISNVLTSLYDIPSIIFPNCLKNNYHFFLGKNYIIDGIVNIDIIVNFFDSKKDYIIFMNKLDGQEEVETKYSILNGLTRDYCFYLSTMNSLPRDRWIEYNFKSSNVIRQVKKMGTHNTIYVVPNYDFVLENVKQHLIEDFHKKCLL